MKKYLYLFLLLFPTVVSAQDFSLFDSALSQVGMTMEQVRFDQDEMAGWGGDKWRLSFFTMFHKNPFKFPKYGDLTLASCSTNVTNITALVQASSRRIDCPVRRGLVSPALEKYTKSRDSMPLPSITSSRNILTEPEFERLRKKIDLIYAITDDKEFNLTKSIELIDKSSNRRKLFNYFVRDSQKYNDEVEQLADQIDLNRMVAGMQDMAEAARMAADSLELCTFPKFKMEVKTRHGLIVIGTTGSDSYDYLEPPLLIIDGGGDDTYSIAGYMNQYPASIIVDPSGNDKYLSPDSTQPGLGGGVMGVSIIIDKSGDDRYESASLAQGCGIFGGGIVLDYSGNDVYRAKTWAQGAASFGIGILTDSAGSDSLYCLSNSQGFGYTQGAGLLVNFEGNDTYVAEDSYLFSPTQQTKDHNASLAQGTGFGKRADYEDGHSWAGGVGILCDLKGNDTYSAGLFAQGCAYWYSVGMLLDGGGDDSYKAVWYVQGSGAHFGAAYLDDFGGNDTYNATMNMSQGSGHDFTIGFLNDRGGNDSYTAPTLSLGGGNANGMGIFWDWSGEDTYITHGRPVLGQANPTDQGVRKFLNCFGIFVDGGGKDTYNEPWADNCRKWIGPKANPENPDPFEIGVGFDN